MNTIEKIYEDSPLGGKARKGDVLVSINGHKIEDVLDYQYYSYDPRLTVVLRAPGGKERTEKVQKGEGRDLGLEFGDFLMDSARSCSNRCVFCFVDQLPRGLRKTLYFKDDDARLSFLTGSYITLTNLSERELDRICDLKISPIKLSVHTTNPALRAKMLGNARGAEIGEQLRRLAGAGIDMDAQIVCCPGWNDGAELLRTMRDLAGLWPRMNSVSIVPVGLTRHREGLAELLPFDAAHAAETIDAVERFAGACLMEYGSRIFFCSDELYLRAGRELPREERYEGYPQLTNGVGMLRLLEAEFLDALEASSGTGVGRRLGTAGKQSLATGTAAAPFIKRLMLTAAEKCDNISANIYAVENRFFGNTVDVAGLVTGKDLVEQLRGRELGARVLIPLSMLRHGEGVFLDDMTLDGAARALNVPVVPVEVEGGALFNAFLGK